MVLDLNAFNKDGAFATGKGEVVHLWLAHEVASTGVNLRRAELLAEGYTTSATLSANNSIKINGTTYIVDAVYDQALLAQVNLDNLLAAFAVLASPTHITVSDGIVQTGANNTTPALGSVSTLVAGTDAFGTELAESAGLVWEVELHFEQKGVFVPRGVKGTVSVGTSANNYGSSEANIHVLLQDTAMYLTGLLSVGGDSENMVDIDTTAAFENDVNYLTETSGAFGTAQGDKGYIISNGDGAAGTSQSVLVEIRVAANLQS